MAAAAILAASIFKSDDAGADTPSHCALDWASYEKSMSETEALKQRYWKLVVEKRKVRRNKQRAGTAIIRKDYVLQHPPTYSGPKEPECRHPEASATRKKTKKKARSPIPVEKDFLRTADKVYGFSPRRVLEAEFMRRYAQEATRVGFSAGQIVGIYALETGGLGPASRQSGIHVINACQLILLVRKSILDRRRQFTKIKLEISFYL